MSHRVRRNIAERCIVCYPHLTVMNKTMSCRYIFQAVHMLFEGSPERPWRDDEPRVSRMVFIGREIDEEALREAFRRCLADPAVDVEDEWGKAVQGAAASATVAGREGHPAGAGAGSGTAWPPNA